MSLVGYPTTCDVKSGWGGSDRSTGNICRLTEQIDMGRPALAGQLLWSHYVDLDVTVDIRDGITRSAGSNAQTYADGDEVRVPSGSSHKFVVVFVAMMAYGTPQAFKRAYLLRHSIDWATYTS